MPDQPRIGFLMEQALGHVTHTRNLQRAYAGSDSRVRPEWLAVPFAGESRLDGLPLLKSNWTLRGSLRAHALLTTGGGPERFSALVYHTQTVALLAPLVARRVPVVLSLDATPLNFDTIGLAYGHAARPGSPTERVKRTLHRRVFQSAAALTTWSQWAKDSLRDDYGIDPDRVTVIAPGVNLDLFSFGRQPRPIDRDGLVRILFVGGDFERKGGPLLLEAMRAGLSRLCELHIVTSRPLRAQPGVHVYTGLEPNDPRLIALYRDADIFALPTRADCLAVVLGEAMAAGLPVVTTRVGAHAEAVRHGVSGLTVPTGDAEALGNALQRLAIDPGLRAAMGHEGRTIAATRFDMSVNVRRLTDVILDSIERWPRRSRAAA